MNTYNRCAVTAILVTTCSTSMVYADVYRCVRDNGHISYQQIRCHQNSKPLSLNHRRSGWTALRSGEQALLKSYREKDAARKRKQPDANPGSGKEAKACWTRKTRLESIKSKLRRGYTLKEGNKLHRQRSEHQSYLRRFCSG